LVVLALVGRAAVAVAAAAVAVVVAVLAASAARTVRPPWVKVVVSGTPSSV
jgi:hypothetical protein